MDDGTVDTTSAPGALPAHAGVPSALGSTPFSCNVCGRSYSRVDHLARHFRSHTKERPFACVTCGKHFSRADLLRRHAAVHTNNAGGKKRSRHTSPPPARVSLACTACSAAKVKCEEGKPCGRCYKNGIPCETPTANNGVQLHSLPKDQSMDELNSPRLHQYSPHNGGPAQAASLPEETAEVFTMQFVEERGERGADPVKSLSQPSSHPPPITNAIPEMPSLSTVQNGLDAIVSDPWFTLDPSLGDFLANVMMPMESPSNSNPSNDCNGIAERDVLAFGMEHGIDFDDFDFALFNPSNTIQPQPPQQLAVDDVSYPPSRNGENQGPAIDVRASEAFQRSLWRFIPNPLDRGVCEHPNLSLPSDVGVISVHTERPCQERLGQSARDKIMAMVMNTCDQAELLPIVSHFPSADVLDRLVQDFLFIHRAKATSYIHVATYEPNSARPEMLAITAACGAVRNETSVVRKLGFALQEAVRLTLPRSWERDNSLTRDLQLLQSNLMSLDVGLWSGNKRKMEISESHLLPLVTMLRRAGRFQNSRPLASAPTPTDPSDILDKKWRAWVERESFKRLVFAVVLYDAQVSMSFFVPPLITYSDIALEMPASEKVWTAGSAQAWREAYFSQVAVIGRHLPNVASCMHDAHVMLEASDQLDTGFSKHILFSMFWRQLWDCRQLSASTNSGSGGPGADIPLVSSHWQQDLAQSIRHFHMTISDVEPLSPPAALVYEHLLLNICVSFEELSRFSGKEGMQEARRTFPLLRKWAQSRDSRQAVWHAGRILQEAMKFTAGALRNFPAIALYHAGLTLWAYGLLTYGTGQSHHSGTVDRGSSTSAHSFTDLNRQHNRDIVLLDGGDSVATQRFIALGRGVPAICRGDTVLQSNETSITDQSYLNGLVFLDDPKAVMETVIRALLRNHGSGDSRSVTSLVENLARLMQDLSHAASKIHKK